MKKCIVILLLACGRVPAEGDACSAAEVGTTVDTGSEVLGCACTRTAQTYPSKDYNYSNCGLKYLGPSRQ